MNLCYDPECSCPRCDGNDSEALTLQQSADYYDLAVLLDREMIWHELEYLLQDSPELMVDNLSSARAIMENMPW